MTTKRPRQSAGVLLVALLALLVGFPSASFAQESPAKPVDPIAGIVDAFKTHDVVALGEGNHGNEQGAVFRDKLYRDPRFQAVATDIVVESGNGRHQAMMDRYIAGENVPEKELRMAWIETTQPHDVWDRDIYADMFRTIREINQKLPKEKQLRVLLGDTPYTYDPTAAVPAPMNRSDSFTAEVIQREVVAKKRKALVVYGGMHFLRRQAQLPPEAGALQQPGTIVSLLEKAGVKVFHIWTFVGIGAGQELTALQPEIASWPKPSLALIKDTTLGVAPFTFYYPKGSGRMTYRGPEGAPVTIDIGEAIGGTMQDQADAILYLAPKSEITYAKLSVSLCADPDYIEMRVKRMGAMAPPGAASPGDAFRMRCNAVVKGPRNAPTPGLEALARKIMDSSAKGEPALDIMAPGLANLAQAQRDSLMKAYARSGPLKSLTFEGATSDGVGDTYLAVFEYNSRSISIVPGADGKVSGFLLGPFLPQTDAQLKASFKAIDLNGDGRLDKTEYRTMLDTIGFAQMFDSLFTQIDDDKDGLLTAREYEAHPQQ
jgi:hypothetical protein